MKKIISILFLVSLLISCGETPQIESQDENRLTLDTINPTPNQNYRVYKLNNCEYIVVGVGHSKWGSHKGDCSNPIHTKEIQVDTTQEEKHFDCYVSEIVEEDEGQYWVYTECGIAFVSEKKYRVGEILKGFRSPKHK